MSVSSKSKSKKGAGKVLSRLKANRLFKRSVLAKSLAKQKVQRPVFEAVEPRILLSADPFSHSVSASNSELTLRIDDTSNPQNIEIINSNSGAVLGSQAISDTSEVSILGSSADDNLTIDASFIEHAGEIAVIFDGAEGEDTIAGPALTTNWLITGENSGSAADNRIRFSDVESIEGAFDNSDSFDFNENGSLTGSVDGGVAGLDTIRYQDDSGKSILLNVSSEGAHQANFDERSLNYQNMEPLEVGSANSLHLWGSSGDDILTLEYDDDTGKMVLHGGSDSRNSLFSSSSNGSIFTFDAKDFSNITLHAGLGSDIISINSFDAAYMGDINIYGDFEHANAVTDVFATDTATIADDMYLHGGSLLVSADQITVNASVQITTEVVADEQAGDITFIAPKIAILSDSVLNASAISLTTNDPDTTKIVKELTLETALDYFDKFDLLEAEQLAEISITGAEITGQSINIKAEMADRFGFTKDAEALVTITGARLTATDDITLNARAETDTPFAADDHSDTWLPSVDEMIELQFDLSNDWLLSLSDATAKVSIEGESFIQAGNNVEVDSTSQSAAAPSFNFTKLAAAWGDSKATAETKLGNGASIEAGHNASLTSNTENSNAVAADAAGSRSASLTLAYGNTESDSYAFTEVGSTITAVGGSVTVEANGETETSISAAAGLSASSGVSGAAAINMQDTDTQAYISGTVIADGDVNVNANMEVEGNSTLASSTSSGSSGFSVDKLKKQFTHKLKTQLIKQVGYEKTSELYDKIFAPASGKAKFEIAGAVAYVDSSNVSKAYIAEGATVSAGGDLNVLSTIEDSMSVNALTQSKADNAVTGAVILATYNNDSDAFVGQKTEVTVAGKVQISSLTLVPPPWDLLVEALDTVEETGDISKLSYEDLTELLASSAEDLIYTSGSSAGSMGKKASLAASVSLFSINNSSSAFVDSGAVITAASLEVDAKDQVTTNNSVGITSKRSVGFIKKKAAEQAKKISLIPDSIQSKIQDKVAAQKHGAGGAANLVNVDSEVEAFIADGAKVTTSEDLDITASAIHSLYAVGIAKGKTEKSSIHGTFSYINDDALVSAYIEDQAQVDAKGLVDVDASTVIDHHNIVLSKDKAGEVSIGASVGISEINAIERAFIGNSAQLSEHTPVDFVQPELAPRVSVDFVDFVNTSLTGSPTLSFDKTGSGEDTVFSITRDDDVSWGESGDGFEVGQSIELSGGSSQSLDGATYVIEAIDGQTLVLSNDEANGGFISADPDDPSQTLFEEGSFSDLQIQDISTPDKIIRADGLWSEDGFDVGQKIYVANTGVNDGEYYIDAIEENILYITAIDSSDLSAGGEALVDQSQVTTASISADPYIQRTDGSWVADGFSKDQQITIDNAGANNGVFQIGSVGDNKLTLASGSVLTTLLDNEQVSIAAEPQENTDGFVKASDITVHAHTQRNVYSGMVAGSQVGGKSISGSAGDAKTDKSKGSSGKYGIGISGAVGINTIEGETRAAIEDGANVQSSGDVDITASNNSHIYALTGGVVVNSGQSSGISGAYSQNTITGKTTALLGDAQLSAEGNLNIQATTSGDIQAISASGSVGTGGKTKVQVAGQASINDVSLDTVAAIDGALGVVEVGALTISAVNGIDILAVAGAVQYGGKAGFGASISINTVENNTGAYIDNAVVDSETTITVSSSNGNNDTDEEHILAVTAALGASKDGMALDASFSLNSINNNTFAYVRHSSGVTAKQDIDISARDYSRIDSIAGAVAAGKTLAVGLSAAYNEISNTVTADISDATVTVLDSDTGNIQVTALSDAEIFSITVGAAASKKVGIGGAGSGNILDNDIHAFLSNSTVSTNGSIAIKADSSDDVEAYVGALGASMGPVGVGGSVGVNLLSTSTKADIANSTVSALGQGETVSVATRNDEGELSQQNAQGLIVVATNFTDIDVISGSVGAAKSVGIGANVIVNKIEQETVAHIDNSNINSNDEKGQKVVVHADQYTDINNIGGAVGVGITAAGFGASVTTDFIDNNTQAYISNDEFESHSLYANELEITATGKERIDTVAIGVGAGKYAGVAGAASVLMSSSTTSAFAELANITTDNDTLVGSDYDLDANFIDGALSGGMVGAGGAVAVGDFDASTSAYIAGSRVNASGNVTVDASSLENIDVLAGTGAVGGTGLAGAVSVLSSSSTTQAYIASHLATDSDIEAEADITVEADSTVNINQAESSLIGAVAIGSNGIGGSVDVITLNNNTSAYIGNNTTATAGDDVIVDANARRVIDSTALSGALGGTAALSGAVSVISIGRGMDEQSQSEASVAQDEISGVFLTGDDGQADVDGLASDDIALALQAEGDSVLFSGVLAQDDSNTGTTAFIGESATITASNNGLELSDENGISVTANETLVLDVVTGAAAIGGTAGIGGSVALVNIAGVTQAYIDKNTTLSSAADIAVAADFDETADINAYGGGAGVTVGLGAQVVIVNDSSVQEAFTGDNAQHEHAAVSDEQGTKIDRADSVNISAEATRNMTLGAKGVAAGSLAAGASIAQASVDGGTYAYVGEHTQVGKSLGSVDSLQVQSTSEINVEANVATVAAGIGAGTGNDVTVDLGSDVHAYVGDNSDINLTGALRVESTATPYVEADILGVAAGGLTVGVSLIDVTIAQDIVATIGNPGSGLGNAAVNINAASVVVSAKSLISDEGYSVKSNSTSASVGALLGVDATINKVNNNTHVRAGIEDNADINVTHAVEVLADNKTKHEAKSGGGAGSLGAAVGVGHAEVNTTTQSYAYVAENVEIDAGSLSINALSNNNNYVDLVTGAVGLALSGAGVRAKTTDSASTKAWIADVSSVDPSRTHDNITLTGSFGSKDGQSGEFEMNAEHTAQFDHKVLVFSGGMLSGTGADIDHIIDLDTGSRVGDNVIIQATDIDIQSGANVNKNLVDGHNLEGYAFGALAGAGSDTDVDLDIDSQVHTGQGTQLLVGGDKFNQGSVQVHALNQFELDDDALFVAAGGLAGVGSYVDIVTSQDIARVNIGETNIESIGDVSMTARGNADIEVNNYTESHGVGTLATGSSQITILPDNDVIFNAGSHVRADGDLRIAAGISPTTDWFTNRDDYRLHSTLDNFSVSVVPISDLNADASLSQSNNVTIHDGAVLETAGIARIYAEERGHGDMKGHADSTTWASELSDAISGSSLSGGTVSSGSLGLVQIDGEVHTGITRNMDLSLTLDEETGAILSEGNIGFTLGKRAILSPRAQDLSTAQQMLAKFRDADPSSDTDIEAFYQSEIDRLTQELKDLGQWNTEQDFYSQPIAPTITLDPIKAQAGYIDIISDSLLSNGSGVLDAPADANVTISNETYAFLDVSDINIPDTTGGVRVNGEVIHSNAQINAQNLEGTGANFSAFAHDGNHQQNTPTITITNMTTPDGGWPQSEDSDEEGIVNYQPDITLTGDVLNYRGNITINNSGNINIEGNIGAANLQITAGGTLNVTGLTSFETGSAGHSIINPLTNLDAEKEKDRGNGAASANPDDTVQGDEVILNALQADSAENLVYADRIVIDASWVNLNGILQSGKESKDLTLGQEVEDFINALGNQSGRIQVPLSGESSKDFSVYYDTQTKNIEIESVAITGGYIDITGKITNIGAGEIKVLGGYGDINITNHTDYNVVVKRVDNSNRGVGKLIIKDTLKGSDDSPKVTIYTMDENGVKVNGIESSSSSFEYDPKNGVRYAYDINEETGSYFHKIIKTRSWAGFDFLASDPDNVTWSETGITLSSTLSDEGAYFYIDESKSGDQYDYQLSDPIELSDKTILVDKWDESYWLIGRTYYAEFERSLSEKYIHTHSVKADHDIAISFLGDNNAGNVSLVSTQAGADFVFAGSVVNNTGSTTVNTLGAIVAADTASIGGVDINLHAAGSIGKQYISSSDMNDDGNIDENDLVIEAIHTEQVASSDSSLTVTSGGEINISERTGGLIISSLSSDSDSAITVVADSITADSDSGSHVKGGAITLTAENGGIAAADGNALLIDSSESLSSRLNVSATGDINLAEISDNLRVDQITSISGDISLEVKKGSLIDANSEEQVDIATYDELVGVWDALDLLDLADDDKNTNSKWLEGKAAFANAKQAQYQAYWSYRNQFAGVYDATQEVSLSVQEDAYYRGQFDVPDGVEAQEAVDTLIAKRSAEYHDLHTAVGSLTTSYDGDYEYQLSFTENAKIEEGIKIWTEDELLSVLAEGILQPVTNTVVNIEAENIHANGDVTLSTYGSMGKVQGGLMIDVADKPLRLSDAEKIALLTAERQDINYLASDFVEATVNFVRNAGADTIERGDGKDWSDYGFAAGDVIRIFETTAKNGSTTNSGENGEVLTIASISGSTITLISSDELNAELERLVKVAVVIQDPLATLDYKQDLSFSHNNESGDVISRTTGSWLEDGFKNGMRITVAGSSDNDSNAHEFYVIANVSANNLTLTGSAELSSGNDAAVTVSRAIELSKIYVDQRDDIDVSVDGELNALANISEDMSDASIYLGSSEDITLGQVDSSGVVRIKTSGSLINGTGNQSTVNVAGENVVLEAATGAIGSDTDKILINVAAGTTITARAQNDIYLSETQGNMDVGTLYSEQGGIALVSQTGAIVDGLNHAYANISAQDWLILSAETGVGEEGNRLELDMKGEGDFLDIFTQSGDIHLEELVGDMNINRVQTNNGDVELVAQTSILDIADKGDTTLPGSTPGGYITGLPEVDVMGNNIELTATTGTIGMSGNDLDINSAMVTAGNLTTTSGLNAYLIETDGDLSLNTISAGSEGGISGEQTAYLLSFGDILNGNADAANVQSGFVQLFATGDIGTQLNPITTEVGFLEGRSIAGDAWIENDGHLNIGGLSNPSGTESHGDTSLSAHSPLTVDKDIISTGGDIYIHAHDSVANVDHVLIKSGVTIDAQDGNIFIYAGDNFTLEAGANLKASGNITIIGDYGNADLQGSLITLSGSINAGGEVLIGGDSDDDTIVLSEGLELLSYTTIMSGAGNDAITVDKLQSRDESLFTDALGNTRVESLFIDGQDGSDSVHVYTANLDSNGQRTDYVITVNDSGVANSGSDTLTIEGQGQDGTPTNDIFLVRENFVARLHGDHSEADYQQEFERINYDSSINGRVLINSWAGDDVFIVDDNSAMTTLDGGQGDDTFQIGQVFGENPNAEDDFNSALGIYDASGVRLGDEIAGQDISAGYLSKGISESLVAFGGAGQDTFSVYSNKANLRLEGESGIDNFVLRAFNARIGDEIIANGGEGDDNFEYNVNAAVSIDGGSGFDSVTALGSEGDDVFIITEDGVYGAGLNIAVGGVEDYLEVDGLEGNDTFFIQSTRDNVITQVIGGLGSDTFNVGGDITADVISANSSGRSAVVNLGTTSSDDDYNNMIVGGIGLNVANSDNAQVVLTANNGSTQVVEDAGSQDVGYVDSYDIHFAIPAMDIDASTLVFVNVSAALSSSSDRRSDLTQVNGEKAASILVSLDGINWSNNTVLTFTKADLNNKQTIYVRAAHDDAIEGERTVMINHSVAVESQSEADQALFSSDNMVVANMEVTVLDNDLGSLILVENGSDGRTQVLEGDELSQITDTYTVQLSVPTTEAVTITLKHSDDVEILNSNGEVITELTFAAGDWDQAQQLTVHAVDDAVIENREMVIITHSFSSTDSVYADAEEVIFDILVVDNDSAGVLVVESEGDTHLVEGQSGDDYTVRLVKAPEAPVTVNVYPDGQVNAVLSDRVFLATLGDSIASEADISLNGDGAAVITLIDGGTWDGFIVGSQYELTVAGGTQVVKVNNIEGSSLTLSTETTLDGATAAQLDWQRVTAAVTFTPDNWYQQVTVELETDEYFSPDPADALVRQEPVREHQASAIRGPLIIEGNLSVGKDRSLNVAVMLPTESAVDPIEVQLDVDETLQADRLNVFNDSSHTDDTGVLRETTLSNDLIVLGDSDNGVKPLNLSGLNMGGSLTVDISESEQGELPNLITIAGGITFDDIEITEIMLGEGNDRLDIQATSRGTVGAEDKVVTVVHGGGNTLRSTEAEMTLDEDRVTRTDGGDFVEEGYLTGRYVRITGSQYGDGLFEIAEVNASNMVLVAANFTAENATLQLSVNGDVIVASDSNSSVSPLVIFGDTSQDGSRYNSQPASGQFTGNASVFEHSGDDVIDVSALDHSVSIYGGAGDDVIYGSSAGDHLAGGSGDDHIDGGNGDDHIYGDSGLNLNIGLATDGEGASLTLDLSVATENSSSLSVADTLVAGRDIIDAGAGNDIVFGDIGIVDLLPGTSRVGTTGNVIGIYTADSNNGHNDIIVGGRGEDIMLGGAGDDTITDNHSKSIVLADLGGIDYTADNNLMTLDSITSTVVSGDSYIGGNDTVRLGDGDDIVFGGHNSNGVDIIDVRNGDNVVLGDNGYLEFEDGDLVYLSTTSSAAGGRDLIYGGNQQDLLVGGNGNDMLFARDGNNLVIGDSGAVDFVSLDGDASDIDLIWTIDDGIGGSDEITGGNQQDTLIGGANEEGTVEKITGHEGTNYMLGDGGQMTAADSDINGLWMTLGRIETTNTALGGKDSIWGGLNTDIVLGGAGADILDMRDGNNAIIGDGGVIELATQDDNPWDIDRMYSIDVEIGGSDHITGGNGTDVIIGGQNDSSSEQIAAYEGDNIIIGDNGYMHSANQDIYGDFFTKGRVETIAPDIGGRDKIYANRGNDLIFGGAGNDHIDAGDGWNTLLHGNGKVEYVEHDNDPNDIDYINYGSSNNGWWEALYPTSSNADKSNFASETSDEVLFFDLYDGTLSSHKESTYEHVYLRGTFNDWQAAEMELVSDNTWQLDVTFDSNGDQVGKFKFDVYADWSHNYGDNDDDGEGDRTGDNILISAGHYRITFNDQTKVYSIEQIERPTQTSVNGVNEAEELVEDEELLRYISV